MATEAVVLLASLLTATIRSACPVVLAAVGEIHSEKAGVTNLGVEGMMMFGAFICFVVVRSTGSLALGVLAAIAAGALLAFVHGVLVVPLALDQTISGIMLGYLAIALADFLGRPLMGAQIENLQPIRLGPLSDLPVIGSALFGQNPLVYITAVVVLLSWALFRYTAVGSMVTAVGDNPRAADAAGLGVQRIRLLSVVYGGMLAGLAGSYMTLNYSSTFVSGLTAGRGWIAIALVFFSTWNPVRAALGGLLFGGIEALQFRLGLLKVQIPYHFLMMLPYAATVLVLVLSGRRTLQGRPAAPQALGEPYRRE